MKRITLIILLLISGISQAGGIDDLIEMERRDATRRASLLESMDRDQLVREQRDTLRTQREMNQLQTLKMLGGQAPIPPLGIQPLGLPPSRY